LCWFESVGECQTGGVSCQGSRLARAYQVKRDGSIFVKTDFEER
jgi:hypothetical protein